MESEPRDDEDTAPGSADGDPLDLPTSPGKPEYEPIQLLGQGGMAQVYLALQRGPIRDVHKIVVLKRMHPWSRLRPEQVRGFVREAKIAMRLSHRNVVHTYAVDVDEGELGLVMEYLEGASLLELLRTLDGKPFAERLPLIGALSDSLNGLHYLHEFRDFDGTPMGLVHRDFKPGNVFVTFEGETKLLDFGVAKINAGDIDESASLAVKGTISYMAPEVAAGTAPIDRRADVFSVGASLWQLASAQSMWPQIPPLEALRRLAARELPELAADAEVPAALVSICRRAVQPDREQRHADVAELRAELDAFLREQGAERWHAALGELVERGFAERRDALAVTIRDHLAGKRSAPVIGAVPLKLDIGAQASAATAALVTPVARPSSSAGKWLGIAAVLAAVGVVVGLAMVTGESETRVPDDPGGEGEGVLPSKDAAPPAAPSGPTRAVASPDAQAERADAPDGRAVQPTSSPAVPEPPPAAPRPEGADDPPDAPEPEPEPEPRKAKSKQKAADPLGIDKKPPWEQP